MKSANIFGRYRRPKAEEPDTNSCFVYEPVGFFVVTRNGNETSRGDMQEAIRYMLFSAS